jgi:hypothetical protein
MKVCGGYRHIPWVQSRLNGFVRDYEAFIFSVNLKKKYIVSNHDFAATDDNEAPKFGYEKNNGLNVLGLQGSDT